MQDGRKSKKVKGVLLNLTVAFEIIMEHGVLLKVFFPCLKKQRFPKKFFQCRKGGEVQISNSLE